MNAVSVRPPQIEDPLPGKRYTDPTYPPSPTRRQERPPGWRNGRPMHRLLWRGYVMFYEGNWIDSFPKNYQWSNATLDHARAWRRRARSRWAKSTKSSSACTSGPTSRTPGRKNGAPMADKDGEQRPMPRRRKRRDATAGNYYLRAGTYYYTGERMVPPGEQKRRDLPQEPALLPGRAQAPLPQSRDRGRALREFRARRLLPEVAASRRAARPRSCCSTASTTARR